MLVTASNGRSPTIKRQVKVIEGRLDAWEQNKNNGRINKKMNTPLLEIEDLHAKVAGKEIIKGFNLCHQRGRGSCDYGGRTVPENRPCPIC